jgi:hypothetical protein
MVGLTVQPQVVGVTVVEGPVVALQPRLVTVELDGPGVAVSVQPSITVVRAPPTVELELAPNSVEVSISVPGPQGPQGPPGPVGSGGDLSFTWTQAIPAAVWHVVHPLNKRPSVTVVDSSHRMVVGEVAYVSDTEVDLTFAGAFAGSAYLN